MDQIISFLAKAKSSDDFFDYRVSYDTDGKYRRLPANWDNDTTFQRWFVICYYVEYDEAINKQCQLAILWSFDYDGQ